MLYRHPNTEVQRDTLGSKRHIFGAVCTPELGAEEKVQLTPQPCSAPFPGPLSLPSLFVNEQTYIECKLSILLVVVHNQKMTALW